MLKPAQDTVVMWCKDKPQPFGLAHFPYWKSKTADGQGGKLYIEVMAYSLQVTMYISRM